MGAEVNEDVIDVMKNAIARFKDRMVDMFPNMETADPNSIWKAVKDKVGLSIMPKAREVENALEYLVPDEDIPREKDVLEKNRRSVTSRKRVDKRTFRFTRGGPLSSSNGTLSRLSGTLRPSQLMTILDASIRPLVQIRSTDTFKLRSTEEKAPSLPEDLEDRVEMLMVPDPMANTLKNEKINSTTRLLVATWAHRVSNVYGKGSTQRKIQEVYSMRAKQLSACITG